MEYNFAEYKEATFQVKLISEQVGIDLKKSIRSLNQSLDYSQRDFIAEIATNLTKSLDKLARQEFYFEQLENSIMDLTTNLAQIKSNTQ